MNTCVGNMEFQYNWFEISGRANFEKYLTKYRGFQYLNFLEIGSFEGMATVWLLENILISPTSRIMCMDTFEGSNEQKTLSINTSNLETRFRNNISKYKDKITILKGLSQELLRTLPVSSAYDFIYIDGSHSAPDVLEDAILAFRLLKKGGTMIFDDYEWRFGTDEIEMPKIAIDCFLNIFNKELTVLEKGYQVIIQKK
jgi:predicted O-methyltransferase YrrM